MPEACDDPSALTDEDRRSRPNKLLARDYVAAVEGEVIERRCVIPSDLQVIIGVASAVVRVSASVDRKQRRKHPEDLDRYERLTEELSRWECARKQIPEEGRGSPLPRWQIVWSVEAEGDSWPMLAVLELRQDGGLALRSVHRRQKAWHNEFMRRSDTVRRGEG